MIVRSVLKIQEGSRIRTNSLDLVAENVMDAISFVDTYCDKLKGVLKGTQTIISARGYEMSYNAVDNRWVQGLPLFETPLSHSGLTGVSPGEDMPIGMRLLINTKDDTPYRDGRLLVSVPYTEGELEADGPRFKLTVSTSIQANTQNAMLDLDVYNASLATSYAVNLHRNVNTPAKIVSHYVRYVEKYRKRL